MPSPKEDSRPGPRKPYQVWMPGKPNSRASTEVQGRSKIRVRKKNESQVRSQGNQKAVNVRISRTARGCVKAPLQPEAACMLIRGKWYFQQPVWLQGTGTVALTREKGKVW